MKSTKAKKDFEKYLAMHGHKGLPPRPNDGVKAMLQYFRDVRADDTDVENDGDMLLFQWGTYDWGEGSRFEIDIVRQFMRSGGEDEDIWQLHLTYRFKPGAELENLGKGNQWCSAPTALLDLETFLSTLPAFNAVSSRDDGSVVLNFECAG